MRSFRTERFDSGAVCQNGYWSTITRSVQEEIDKTLKGAVSAEISQTW